MTLHTCSERIDIDSIRCYVTSGFHCSSVLGYATLVLTPSPSPLLPLVQIPQMQMELQMWITPLSQHLCQCSFKACNKVRDSTLRFNRGGTCLNSDFVFF